MERAKRSGSSRCSNQLQRARDKGTKSTESRGISVRGSNRVSIGTLKGQFRLLCASLNEKSQICICLESVYLFPHVFFWWGLGPPLSSPCSVRVPFFVIIFSG